MDNSDVHRPRNVDWKRAAALLYGDWGTSKAYVIGLAFFYAAFGSLPIIIAVCVLTALVGYNYTIVCRHFPDGGGVYSAARSQNRFLAAIGALLLVANFIVTAALSCNSAMHYIGVPERYLAVTTITSILIIGAVNAFGPKHSGSLAVWLAVPMVAAVLLIVAMSLPYLSLDRVQPPPRGFWTNWRNFVAVILALSGVEAVANLTGVMKLDPGSTMDKPSVGKTARKAILLVALEVVAGTILLGWAMVSLPEGHLPDPLQNRDYMLRFIAQEYATLTFGSTVVGHVIAVLVGGIVALLLLSAVNTAIAALIGLIYLLGRDGEMPRSFTRLNHYGVPWWPLILATLLPVVTVAATGADIESLARLYAIGVVGAIAVNLGACLFNRQLGLALHERLTMGLTFVVLFAVELTIARLNHDALFFAICVLGIGLALRSYAQRRAGLRTVTVSEGIAARVAPDSVPAMELNLAPGQTIMVAARGVTPLLRFALEEAQLRQGSLYVLYVKELAVSLPGTPTRSNPARWQHDHQAAGIMTAAIRMGEQHKVPVVPVYAISDDPATTILDLAATFGVDILMLGAPQRRRLVQLLKGDVVTQVARNLPENIQLVIHG